MKSPEGHVPLRSDVYGLEIPFDLFFFSLVTLAALVLNQRSHLDRHLKGLADQSIVILTENVRFIPREARRIKRSTS